MFFKSTNVRVYDLLRPVVCMDETSKQLIGETRLPVNAGAGSTSSRGLRVRAAKEWRDLFMFFEPLRGWRRVWITPQRRKVVVGVVRQATPG